MFPMTHIFMEGAWKVIELWGHYCVLICFLEDRAWWEEASHYGHDLEGFISMLVFPWSICFLSLMLEAALLHHMPLPSGPAMKPEGHQMKPLENK